MIYSYDVCIPSENQFDEMQIYFAWNVFTIAFLISRFSNCRLMYPARCSWQCCFLSPDHTKNKQPGTYMYLWVTNELYMVQWLIIHHWIRGCWIWLQTSARNFNGSQSNGIWWCKKHKVMKVPWKRNDRLGVVGSRRRWKGPWKSMIPKGRDQW